MLGVVQNQDSYAQGVAAQRPFYFDHVAELTDRAFDEFAALTGRRYARASGYRMDDAEYVIARPGITWSRTPRRSPTTCAETRGLKVGVRRTCTMFRPFPADLVTRLLAGKKGVVVLERTDQPLAVDPPLLREMRAAMAKGAGERPRRTRRAEAVSRVSRRSRLTRCPTSSPAASGSAAATCSRATSSPRSRTCCRARRARRQFYLGIDFVRKDTRLPKLQIWQEQLLDALSRTSATLALPSAGDLNLLPDGLDRACASTRSAAGARSRWARTSR